MNIRAIHSGGRTTMKRWAATIGFLLVLIGWQSIDAAAQGVVPPEIAQKAQAQGIVRVIVRLDIQISPEGRLDTLQAVEVQRRAIAFAQSFLLAELAGTRHRVIRQFQTIPFVALEVDADALAAVERSSLVIGVAEDRWDAPLLPQSGPLVEADQAWALGFDGTGWSVAILDTGVDNVHPFLSGKVVEEACFSTNSSCPDGSTTQIGPGAGVPCTYAVRGCRHDTHVAGIAAGQGDTFSGVARGATLIAIQVFSRVTGAFCAGQGEDPCALSAVSDQIAGLENVLSLAGSVSIASVNMSLGGGGFTNQQSCDAANAARKAAIDNLRSLEIATVAASGNDGFINAVSVPACISTAVSVGSTTKADSISSFSNSATFLSLLAPGSSIFSLLPNAEFGFLSGTSMATPHVAGAWAILKQSSPAATVSALLDVLQRTGLPIADPRNGVTISRIQILQALDSLGGAPNLVVSPIVIQAGGTLTATWDGIATPTATDWIGLFAPNTADTAYIDWIYVSCSQTRNSARVDGSCPFVLPANLAPGTYELRLLANDGFTRLATSNAFTVTADGVSLTASPTSIPTGGTVVATWSGIASPTTTDWLGLYEPGTNDTAFLAWRYTDGQASGTLPFELPGTLAPGTTSFGF